MTDTTKLARKNGASKTRTTKQIEANKIDLEVFNVINKIDRFASQQRDSSAHEMADIIDGLRWRIRKHMHDEDQKTTNGPVGD